MSSSTALHLSPQQIATLSRTQIAEMETDDLVAVISTAELPFLTPDELHRLPVMARKTLEKLVFLAREMCRNTAVNPRWNPLAE